ncbi:MAG: TadE family protein [Pseudomonadota bacterium]
MNTVTSSLRQRRAQRTLHPRQHGAAVVELAIVLIVMTLLSAGIFEFSRAFWYYNALDKATRDGARYLSALPLTEYATTTKTTANVTAVQGVVVSAVNGSNLVPALKNSDVSVSWSCTPPCGGGIQPTWVKVSISYSITLGGTLPLIGMVSGNSRSITLQPATQMRFMN